MIIDIDRNSLKMIITDIFTQIERFSADNERAYVEVYRQDGKVVYIVKITVAPDKTEEAIKPLPVTTVLTMQERLLKRMQDVFVVTFDNGMICATEQHITVLSSVYDEVKALMKDARCYFLNDEERPRWRRYFLIPRITA